MRVIGVHRHVWRSKATMCIRQIPIEIQIRSAIRFDHIQAQMKEAERSFVKMIRPLPEDMIESVFPNNPLVN